MQILIEKIVYPGKSLSTVGGKVVFTDEGLPGELVEIIPIKEKKNYIQAKTIKILKKSAHRVESCCPHYKACSPYQYIDYPFQVEIKKSQLQEIFRHDLKIELANIEITPSTKIWGYRNKVHLHLIREKDGLHLAYHQTGMREEFAKIKECFLISEKMNALLASLLRIIEEKKLDGIEEVAVKESVSSGEMLLILYLNPQNEIGNITSSLARLKEKFPIKGLVGLIRTKKAMKETILEGKNFIEEKAADLVFRIGPQSFFQINTDLLEEVIKDMKKIIPLGGKERIADLYCGLGTFGITLASKVQEVFGVESSPENIVFLKKNLALNRIGNFTACEGTSEEWIDWILNKKIDVLIVDPPRRGMSSAILKAILKKPVPLIIYISCNPSTLVRDLKQMFPAYSLKDIHIYDFFPHTPHLETCSILQRGRSINAGISIAPSK